MFPLRRSSLESAGWGSLEVEDGPSGPADVAPLRAISVSVASLSPIAATPPSANANASVADLVEDAEDVEGHVHVSENVLLGDENDVFVMGISHAAAALVKVAPSFDAIEEWLAENEDYEVPMYDQPPVKVPAKHPSGGSDPSRVKRARSISSTSSLKDASHLVRIAAAKAELHDLLRANEIYWAQLSHNCFVLMRFVVQ
ncbi:hypothetical protein V6N13_040127 [Hibiscus sabdariffa]